MKIFSVENLSKLSAKSDLMPWDFQAKDIPPSARTNKAARQAWYNNPTTSHCFYTGLEGLNDNQRPSKTNEPRAIHAFVADYDLPIPDLAIQEGISKMRLKPSWIEHSLGGNRRLIWLLESPIITGDADLTSTVLEKAVKWLQLGMLPGLDEGAFLSFSRLYCRGDLWLNTGHPPIPADESQAFFVACCKGYSFKSIYTGVKIPMETVEARLKEVFPNFNWPSDFTPESKGPTFWIPESVSPASAIVKEDGMFTFAAHALKPFYNWSELLGADFVKEYRIQSVSEATRDIWCDGKHYWKKVDGVYRFHDSISISRHMKVSCGISAKADPDTGVSCLEEMLEHVSAVNRVAGVAPFVCHPDGLLITPDGHRVLNNYRGLVPKPAEKDDQQVKFGERWPFTHSLLYGLMDPPEQIDYLIAWFQRIYKSALFLKPSRGHNVMIMGPAHVGKSLIVNEIFGKALGGSMDASQYLLHGDAFGGELFERILWTLEDDAPASESRIRQRFFSKLKQMAANDGHKYSQKFLIPTQVQWFGRVCVTANVDLQSATVIPPLDDSSGDKLCLFRTVEKHPVKFANREEIQKLLEAERPYFLRDILDWTPPPHVKPETNGERFGFVAYHDPSLLRLSHLVNDVSPLAELVSKCIMEHFILNPARDKWIVTSSELFSELLTDPVNERVIRGTNLRTFSRQLYAAAKAELFTMKFNLTENPEDRRKEWCFYRPN